MKKFRRAQSSSLFMIELMIVIFFFALASCVCLQVFAKAHTISQDGENLTLAVSQCSCAAEIIQSSDSTEEAASSIERFFSDAPEVSSLKADGRSFTVEYDDLDMMMTIDFKTESSMIHGDIEMTKNGKSIYRLEVKRSERE